jgi:hypothetical protein
MVVTLPVIAGQFGGGRAPALVGMPGRVESGLVRRLREA